MEVWRSIPNYEGFYEASDQGRIRSVPRTIPRPGHPIGDLVLKGRVLKPCTCRLGYKKVCLCKDKRQRVRPVHRLVAAAFLGDCTDLEVNHKNGDKSDNTLPNLELVTRRENVLHALNMGLMKPPPPRKAKTV